MTKIVFPRGPSGAGKSTYTQDMYPDAAVFSADHYFLNTETGEYRFDMTKLGVAHAAALRDFIDWCRSPRRRERVAVIDNTNTTIVEMAPYVAVAKAYMRGVDLEFINLPLDDADLQILAERNKHGVDLKTIRRQSQRLRQNQDIPRMWKQ